MGRPGPTGTGASRVERRPTPGGTVIGVTTPATEERHRLADALLDVGPDAATLCEGWTARDLAAHIVMRDRRPDALPGVLFSALSGYVDRIQDKISEREWHTLVEQVRQPPAIAPARIDLVNRLINTSEFFVHHEDVRRAQPGWEPRPLDDDLVDDLEAALRRAAKLLTRKAPAGITLEPDGGRHRIVAKDAEPMVVVRGPIGELVLWVFGRQDHARVSYDGPDDAVEQLRTAGFGL